MSNQSDIGSAAYTRRALPPPRINPAVMEACEDALGEELARALANMPPIYHEVHRRVGDDIKVTTCCCKRAGATARECMAVSGNKTPCRCYCHSRRIRTPTSK